jgi:hypothetical protein
MRVALSGRGDRQDIGLMELLSFFGTQGRGDALSFFIAMCV